MEVLDQTVVPQIHKVHMDLVEETVVVEVCSQVDMERGINHHNHKVFPHLAINNMEIVVEITQIRHLIQVPVVVVLAALADQEIQTVQ